MNCTMKNIRRPLLLAICVALIPFITTKADDKQRHQLARQMSIYSSIINELNLSPKVLVFYQRESYKNSDGLRITFDENLKYRCRNLNFNKAKNDKIYFDNTEMLFMKKKPKRTRKKKEEEPTNEEKRS